MVGHQLPHFIVTASYMDKCLLFMNQCAIQLWASSALWLAYIDNLELQALRGFGVSPRWHLCISSQDLYSFSLLGVFPIGFIWPSFNEANPYEQQLSSWVNAFVAVSVAFMAVSVVIFAVCKNKKLAFLQKGKKERNTTVESLKIQGGHSLFFVWQEP